MTSCRSVIGVTSGDNIGTTQILQYLPRGVGTRCGHYTTTGVSAGATHIHAAHRPAVLRITRERPVEKQLVEGELALENITLGQACLCLDFARSTSLAVQDQVLEIRTVGRDLVYDRFLETGFVCVSPLTTVDCLTGDIIRFVGPPYF